MLIISMEIKKFRQNTGPRECESGMSLTEHRRPSLVDDIQADGPAPMNPCKVSRRG